MMNRGCSVVRNFIFRRCGPASLAAIAVLAASSLKAQTFDPSVTVGAGIRTSFDHTDPTVGSSLDQFALNDARIYLSGTVTKNIGVMFNTDYDQASNTMQILDAVGQIDLAPQAHFWFGRFLPPSDRANLYGPFYANEWAVYSDGIQDGYTFVFQGRDDGLAYWGDFKAGIAKIKVSVGAFDGGSSTHGADNRIITAARVQIDFWDPENGYYLNGTYYGDKNLLAIGGATQDQAGKTASTVDFLMERKVMGGGAFTIESEFSRYNRLGGYTSDIGEESKYRSEGAYILASFLIPKQVGIGKFEGLGKYAEADFTGGLGGPGVNPSFRQKTSEFDFSYIMKQFDARLMAFGENTSYSGTGAPKEFWQAGLGLQLQISKSIH